MPGVVSRNAGSAVTGGAHDHRERHSGGPGKGPRAYARLTAALTAGVAALQPCAAYAQASGASVLGAWEVIQLAVFVGTTGAAMLSAIWLIRERTRTADENLDLRERLSQSAAVLQRTESLLNLNDQKVVVWMNEASKPEIVGALPASRMCGHPI